MLDYYYGLGKIGGDVSWGSDPWARRLAGSPHLTSPFPGPTGWNSLRVAGTRELRQLRTQGEGPGQRPRRQRTKDIPQQPVSR